MLLTHSHRGRVHFSMEPIFISLLFDIEVVTATALYRILPEVFNFMGYKWFHLETCT